MTPTKPIPTTIHSNHLSHTANNNDIAQLQFDHRRSLSHSEYQPIDRPPSVRSISHAYSPYATPRRVHAAVHPIKWFRRLTHMTHRIQSRRTGGYLRPQRTTSTHECYHLSPHHRHPETTTLNTHPHPISMSMEAETVSSDMKDMDVTTEPRWGLIRSRSDSPNEGFHSRKAHQRPSGPVVLQSPSDPVTQ